MERDSARKGRADAAVAGDMQKANGEIAAIILAGGFSRRMGAFKPLLKVGDRPAVDVLVRVFASAGVKRIIIVTGHEHEMLERHIECDLTVDGLMSAGAESEKEVTVGTIFNENYSVGMFASVQKGIEFVGKVDRAAGGGVSGTFLIPVDCPAVSAETIRTMLKCIGSNSGTSAKDSFCVPTYMGKKGHPLYIPKEYWQEILEYDGENGLGGFTENHTEKMINVPVDDEGILLDMDDVAGYERVNDYYTNASGPDLQTQAKTE